jgi:hypothetical protein
LKKRLGAVSVATLLVVALFTWATLASDAQMYFSSDKNGQNRVTNIQEGDEVWIVVIDNDNNIDCDVRDKIWTDVKIMDPKTGAYIIWVNGEDLGVNLDLRTGDDDVGVPYSEYTRWYDFLEESGADTGVFVSDRAFQIGTRFDFDIEQLNTHVVDVDADEFQWGDFLYTEDGRLPNVAGGIAERIPMDFQQEEFVGRFENMDTLLGLYQDPNEATDVAVAMMKIIDTEGAISWDQTIYKDANTAATITVVDPDENLNCNEIEYVPVFILVNPGSWNPWDGVEAPGISPTNFCMLKRNGGVNDAGDPATVVDVQIRWFNIYDSGVFVDLLADGSNQPNDPGTYYIQYPNPDNGHDGQGAEFQTASDSGVTRVMFWAQETGVDTGTFQLNLNSILKDLGFETLDVRDVLVAYYLDPNDFDDFKLATAYIEEMRHSITSFTDATRADKDLYWIGRDPVYVQVIDANANVDPCCPEQVVVHICDPHGEDDSEWLVLDETSSNSPVFFSNAGTQLWPVWDALGNGIVGRGGYQLQLDNWKLEVFNEDDLYVRYNDVYYEAAQLPGLGDRDVLTAFPPRIDRVRVANDVSFDVMSIADTQVFDGTTTQMFFLDRQGGRVSGYVNSDCVFVEVVDPDQDEDQYRRERIDGYWDGFQNLPFGPMALNPFECDTVREFLNPFNPLLGDTNIFNDGDLAKLYILNPRSGRWAAVDLLETGVATGDFVSVICIDLVDVYECVPSLAVLPGDTVVAFYQDPSNHSDSAMIAIKVGIGGGGTPPTQASTTMFVDADGNDVANYTDADLVYVKVIDPSHTGAALLANAVEIDGETYDLTLVAGDEFMTIGLDLGLEAGVSITAAYTDPTDPTDTSSDMITIVASVLDVGSFYAGPNPFDDECVFAYTGTGTASMMSVEIYDLAGALVWESGPKNDVTEIVWDGAGLANGAYIYMIYATDGTNTFNPSNTPSATGKVFVNR